WIFSLLLLICCCVTLYHFVRILYPKNTNENDKVLNSFFYEFSFIVSIKTLLKYDKNNELNFFYTTKLMTILSVIYGHKLYVLMSYPTCNAKFIDNFYLNGPPILLTGFNIVDPLFFISGYLVFINLSREFRKPEDESVWKTLLKPIIQRILRILPAYCAVIAITAYIIPHLGYGPLWPSKSWEEAEICKNYWWANLLFISNFVHIKHQVVRFILIYNNNAMFHLLTNHIYYINYSY
ncbi:nose resistant to fluoxetine protein 6-like isoform X1, partial [Aphis craccivora]